MKKEHATYLLIKKRLHELGHLEMSLYGLDLHEREEYAELEEQLRVFLEANPQYAI